MAVRLRLRSAGHCTHWECLLLSGGSCQSVSLPAGFAILEHPVLGLTLFDTGYSTHLVTQTRRFPDRLHALATRSAIRSEDTARSQVEALGFSAEEVRHVVISHFHADHIAGLADFPRARYLFSRAELDSVRHKRGLARLLAAFVPGLLPEDFEERASPLDWSRSGPLPGEFAPFERGLDLAGDGSVLAVELPGHTLGHFGLFVREPGGSWTLLSGDACWLGRGYRENLMPHRIVSLIFSSWSDTRATLGKLHELHLRRPDIAIVPSHCAESIAAARARWEPEVGHTPSADRVSLRI